MRKITLSICGLLLATMLLGQAKARDVTQAPTTLESKGRIAPADEPGTPVVISGTVVAKMA